LAAFEERRFHTFNFSRMFKEKANTERRNFMANTNDNRVLNRRGARQLTSDELEQINGAGGGFTRASLTGTNMMHSPDTDMDS
jgi:hypothetical protein